MRFVWAALILVSIAACTARQTQVAGGCGSAADQTVAQGGGRGPSCEGPPVTAANPYASKLYDSGRQGGDVGHSGRAGVYEH